MSEEGLCSVLGFLSLLVLILFVFFLVSSEIKDDQVNNCVKTGEVYKDCYNLVHGKSGIVRIK